MSSEVLPKDGIPTLLGPPSPGREGSGSFSHWRRAPSIGQSKGLDGHWEQQNQEKGSLGGILQ